MAAIGMFAKVSASLLAIALTSTCLVAQAPPPAVLTPGVNSRGYVAANQQFTQSCATSVFSGRLPRGPYEPQNVTFDASTGCGGPGWTGVSLMDSDASTIRSLTSVRVTDPALLLANGVTNLVSLSRVAFLNGMLIPTSAPVSSVSFTFLLNGSVDISTGANTLSTPTLAFDMAWNSNLGLNLNQGLVQSSGLYSFTFDVTPAMLGQWIPYVVSLQSLASLYAIDRTQMFDGSALTDYSHTLAMTRLQFFDAQGVDITESVDAQFEADLVLVPEPSTFVMSAVGLIGCVAAFQRRRCRTPRTPA